MFKQEKNRIGTKPFWMGITFFLLLGCNLPPVLPLGPSVTVAPPVTPKVPPPGMVLVQGGIFTMGSTFFGDAKPIEGVAVASFYLDITLVTATDYQACIDAGRCDAPVLGVQTSPFYNYDRNVGQVVPGKERHPINGVTFQQAKHYCKEQGKRLPTEIEWEYAARGNTNHIYPWGDEDPTGKSCWTGLLTGTCPVQNYGPTLLGMNQSQLDKQNMLGVYDLVGNVLQWVDTQYAGGLSWTNTICTDPMSRCVMRGGPFNAALKSNFHPAFRLSVNPADGRHSFGFRCARNEQP